MAKYIECDAAIAETLKPRFTDAELRRRLANIPAADVAPVRRGRWEQVEVERVEEMDYPPAVVASMFCPVCHHWHNEVYFYVNPTENVNYCPFCGAKMEKEDK